jgi:hypothetical protein
MTETSPPAFLSDERFICEHRKVFVMFMGRDGYSEEMATEEFPRLHQTVKPTPAQSPTFAFSAPAPALPSTDARRWRLQKSTIRQGNMRTTATALRSASGQSDWTFLHSDLPISRDGLFKLIA